MAALTRRRTRAPRSGGWADDAGQSLVEFALIAPILILLVLGTVEFARAWHAYHTISGTARDAARTAVLANTLVTQDSVLRLVRNSLRSASLDPGAAVVTVQGMTGGTGEPTSVEIRYPYRFSLLGPLGALATGNRQLTLSTLAVMRHE